MYLPYLCSQHLLTAKFPEHFSQTQVVFQSWSQLNIRFYNLKNSIISPVCGFFCCFFNLFILFIDFWLRWVFVAVRGLSLVAASGGYSVAVRGFLIAVASLVAEHRLQALGFQLLSHSGFSSCGSRALERRLSSCGAWAQLLCGMWNPPGPGIEPTSPATAGGFLTTAPPGKSPSMCFVCLLFAVTAVMLIYSWPFHNAENICLLLI